MLTLQSITLREIHLPLVEPFTISSGTESMRRILLVMIEDVDGAKGWGECVAGALPNYNAENIDTAWLALSQWVAPAIIGHPFKDQHDVYPMLGAFIRGHEMARASVEMACWELVARKKGVSLSKLIGGTRETIATGISIGIQDDPEALVKKIEGCLSQGYRKIKMKIKPGFDLAYVQAVYERFGDLSRFMVDANNAYRMEDVPLFKKLDAFGLLMIEQPLAWDDVVKHAALQQQLETPICLDESITSLSKAEDMVALDSGRIINIKPGRVGGFASSIAIHDFAQAHAIPVWCGGMLESGIGRAFNVALASLPNFTLPGDVSPSRRYWERDIISPEWEMDENGMIRVPRDKPGLGVTVDMDRIDNLTVRKEVINH